MKIDVDGASVYAYTGGRTFDPALPVVVFLHGAQHDHSVWALQSRYLAHHGRAVLAVYLPGHGRSAGPALTTVQAMADWTLALLAAAGAKSASLVGHSMGSLIALEAAARSLKAGAPAIDRIALVATAYPMRVSDLLLDAAANDEPRAFKMIGIWSSDATHGGYSHKPSAPGPGFGIVWGGRRLMQRQSKGVLSIDFNACNAYADGEKAAQDVGCPVLFVLGEKDAMTMARAGAAFATTMRDARVVLLPGVGHMPMAEAPDATLDVLKEFV